MASGVGPGDNSASEKAGVWVVSMFGGTPRQLRTDADGAVVSPDDRRIAFRTTKGPPEIWVMDADGGSARKLLSAGPREHFGKLQWSADGKFLAYIHYRTEPGKEVVIETREVDGDRTATPVSDPGMRTFCWVPDGRIIFSRRASPAGGDMNLWSVAVSGRTGQAKGKPEQLTNWAGFVFSDMNVTADSRRLIFIKEAQQTDVYIADLNARGAVPQAPARLTVDEWVDIPSAWTPDATSVIFYSDRNGSWGMFKERVGGSEPEQLMAATEDQTEPRLSPHRDLILYWDKPAADARTLKLVRVPVQGGASEQVLEAVAGAHFRCGSRAGAACVLAELDPEGKQLVFATFDPQAGKQKTLSPVPGSAATAWDLSPDGTTIALMDPDDTKHVRLVDLNRGTVRAIDLHGDLRASAVAWASDGQSLYALNASVRGSALLNIDLEGAISELWSGKSLALSSPVPSPDGKRIAFAGSTFRSNVWLIEGF